MGVGNVRERLSLNKQEAEYFAAEKCHLLGGS